MKPDKASRTSSKRFTIKAVALGAWLSTASRSSSSNFVNQPVLNYLFRFRVHYTISSRGAMQPPADQNGSWTTFWNAFRAAVQRRDRAALKRMMTPHFSAGGGDEDTPDKWIRLIDARNAWGDFQKSVDSGTKPLRVLAEGLAVLLMITILSLSLALIDNGVL
jgi:hypothetical protein